MLMPTVYVAGPFRARPNPNDQWGQTQNIRRAEEVAHKCWSLGFAALCPHLNTAHFQGSLPDSVWLDGDLALLAGCDALLVAVSGYTLSTGTLAEIEFALERGIPVFYNIAELQQWGRERRG